MADICFSGTESALSFAVASARRTSAIMSYNTSSAVAGCTTGVCCMLHVACCTLHVACCMLHAACVCCMLQAGGRPARSRSTTSARRWSAAHLHGSAQPCCLCPCCRSTLCRGTQSPSHGPRAAVPLCRSIVRVRARVRACVRVCVRACMRDASAWARVRGRVRRRGTVQKDLVAGVHRRKRDELEGAARVVEALLEDVRPHAVVEHVPHAAARPRTHGGAD